MGDFWIACSGCAELVVTALAVTQVVQQTLHAVVKCQLAALPQAVDARSLLAILADATLAAASHADVH